MAEPAEDIRQDLEAAFGLTPTGDQAEAFTQLGIYLQSATPYEVFVLKGAAGTGKTSLLHAVVPVMRRRKYRLALMAPTGRAAKVAARKAGIQASTIHHAIYTTKVARDGRLSFELKDNTNPMRTMYIVDEASMLDDSPSGGFGGSDGLLRDLLRFIFRTDKYARVLFVGDPAQLPPVGLSRSPALSQQYLRDRLNLSVMSVNMTEVKRQALESGILMNATKLRAALSGGAPTDIPPLTPTEDVVILENATEAIDLFQDLYDPENPESVVLLAHANSVTANFNQAVRPYLHDDPGEITESDVVMVVKNFYYMLEKRLDFVANGEAGTITRVKRETAGRVADQNWVEVEVEFLLENDELLQIETMIPLDLLYSKSPNLTAEEQRAIYAGRLEQRRREGLKTDKQSMKQDPFINALQLKMGYAITGHKAQGGQWDHVIVAFNDYQFRPRDEADTQYLVEAIRWTYTALTRAAQTLYIINYPVIEGRQAAL